MLFDDLRVSSRHVGAEGFEAQRRLPAALEPDLVRAAGEAAPLRFRARPDPRRSPSSRSG